ncbi:polyprenyl synthetase family protein [Ornithinibacillus massiliensis]|uniref:Polyprenyl synthetase family protein n=1 Tax=Ornithinibacillus massiliensis TaxID=1944633 RepID=A0ABS5M8W7_9BACI|nr:polyprenyl synthetase family protein [Ornithinibacillus massiliensis]MBS3678764.1 polyprenyl synthetase family protein [Ornithinibacillus massiliensis]
MEKQLIYMAKSFVDKGFMEDSIKNNTKDYIEYKFNQSIEFAKITAIHFDIFRDQKINIHKVKAMTIIELIILISDIMDDMQDEDTRQDAPWSKVDNAFNFNIIVGILLICLKEMNGIGNFTDKSLITQRANKLLLQSISGQQIDLKNELSTEMDYFYMCYLKSGSLIALACLLGAGSVNKQLSKKIIEYANYLGVIFQLRNDVNDMKNGFEKNDLLYRKRTLPILFYLNTEDEAYTRIQNYYSSKNSSNLDVSTIHQDLMIEDALIYCWITEKIFIRKYERVISQLNITKKQKTSLLSIISS